VRKEVVSVITLISENCGKLGILLVRYSENGTKIPMIKINENNAMD
jgi:hypothetical protein